MVRWKGKIGEGFWIRDRYWNILLALRSRMLWMGDEAKRMDRLRIPFLI